MSKRARNLEIDGPRASCGYCQFTSPLRGTWSVEDGRLVWRGDESPQPGRGPDLRGCCEGHECGEFAGIAAEGAELSAEDVAALRETDLRAEMRDCPWRFPDVPLSPLRGTMTTAPETGDDMAEFFDQWPEVGDEFPADPPADPDAGYAEVCDYGRPMYCACGRRMYSTGCDAPGCPGARCGHCDIGCDIDLNENGRCTTAIAEEGS